MAATNHIERFREHLRSVRATRTVDSYVKSALKLEEFVQRIGISIESAKPDVLERMVEDLRTQGAGAATIHVTIAGSLSYLQFLRRAGEISFDPNRPSLPRIVNRTPTVFSDDELVHYYAAVQSASEPSRTILLLLPRSGLRIDEACSLPMRAVRVEKDRQKRSWIVLIVTGKGDKMREVPLLPAGSKVLLEYLRGWRRSLDSVYLFPSKSNMKEHVSPFTVRHYTRSIRVRIGARVLTPHLLRRTYLTRLREAGWDPVEVARIAGHASVQTTYKSYFAPIPVAKVIEKMQNVRI